MAEYTGLDQAGPGEPEVRKRSREIASAESSPMNHTSPPGFKRAKYYASAQEMAIEINQDLESYSNMNSNRFDKAVSRKDERIAHPGQSGTKSHDDEQITEELDEVYS